MRSIVEQIILAWTHFCRHKAKLQAQATHIKTFWDWIQGFNVTLVISKSLPFQPALWEYHALCLCLFPKIRLLSLWNDLIFVEWRLKNNARGRRDKMCYRAALVRPKKKKNPNSKTSQVNVILPRSALPTGPPRSGQDISCSYVEAKIEGVFCSELLWWEVSQVLLLSEVLFKYLCLSPAFCRVTKGWPPYQYRTFFNCLHLLLQNERIFLTTA